MLLRTVFKFTKKVDVTIALYALMRGKILGPSRFPAVLTKGIPFVSQQVNAVTQTMNISF
jgi:hypothetical protein